MDAARLVDLLEGQADLIARSLEGLEDRDLRWKPAADRWSLLEILGHLLDEERVDFRARLRFTLESPEEPWPPDDPRSRVVEGRFNEQEVGTVREAFLRERRASVAWLRGLEQPDWARQHHEPTFPPLAAGELLASWVAHDLLHLQQLIGVRLALAERDAAPHAWDYAR